jgi:hypothetical protein
VNDTGVEFIAALVVSGECLYLAGSPDSFEPYTPFTRMFSYYRDRNDRPWTHHDLDWWIVALEMGRREDGSPVRCILSQEGEFGTPSSGKMVFEKITDAGVSSPGAKGYGYVSGLRHIGEHLYVCGGGGQAYQRRGPDEWVHMDDGLLQDRKVLAEGRLLLRAIEGAAEDDIYVAGSLPGKSGYEGVLFHWDGATWMPIPLPAVKQINAVHVESASRIWLCGIDGALLVGDHRGGFENWSDVAHGQLFYDLTMYDDTLYLASSTGLCAYDGKRRRVVRVQTGLKPEPKSVSHIDHADGILWCVGSKDIVRFDGTGWTRIHHPDNRKIGG